MNLITVVAPPLLKRVAPVALGVLALILLVRDAPPASGRLALRPPRFAGPARLGTVRRFA